MSRLITRRIFIAAAPAIIAPASLLQSRVALAGPTAAPKDAYCYILWPNDGEKIKGGFWCRFGLRNMGVAPAGVRSPNAGHHHLYVDVDEPINPDEPIPQDKKHLHFGAGQTEARIELPPGTHSLQLVLGDADHIPFNPVVASKKIHITVT
jgi:Domain of unknown function (DUF4399)